MSSVHDQAMQYVYRQVLQRLMERFSPAQRASLQLLIQRVIVAAGGYERVGSFKVMYAHGGGKDSVHALAFLRAAQLSIAARAQATFNLRIATARHAGMTADVIANIERGYSALFVQDDPRVEVLVLDDAVMQPFDSAQLSSPNQRQADRNDLLLAGHLAGGVACPPFCGCCYAGLADLYRHAMAWDGGVDAVISADPLPERKRYLAWGRRKLRRAGVGLSVQVATFPRAMIDALSAVRRQHLQRLLGLSLQTQYFSGNQRPLRFIAIDDLVHQPFDAECEVLSAFLGFQCSEHSCVLSESDCVTPLLSAHLWGLRREHVHGQCYADGVSDYLKRAGIRMQRKQMSPLLQREVLAAWQGADQLAQRRQQAADLATQAYGLSEAQLICLLFAPFIEGGKRLEPFLRQCHPGMLVALPYMHKALREQRAPEPVVQWLVNISGLPLSTLQTLYWLEAETLSKTLCHPVSDLSSGKAMASR